MPDKVKNDKNNFKLTKMLTQIGNPVFFELELTGKLRGFLAFTKHAKKNILSVYKLFLIQL